MVTKNRRSTKRVSALTAIDRVHLKKKKKKEIIKEDNNRRVRKKERPSKNSDEASKIKQAVGSENKDRYTSRP